MAPGFFDDPSFLAPPRVVRQDLPGGGFVLRSPEPLQPHARCAGEWLEHWASATPDALALAERGADGDWQRLSYAQVRRAVGAIGQSLLDMALPDGAPVVVLSDNGLDHALLMLAAMHVGRPVCTVSSAYCRLTKDYSKIAGILRTLGPALVYASHSEVYGPALTAADVVAPAVFSTVLRSTSHDPAIPPGQRLAGRPLDAAHRARRAAGAPAPDAPGQAQCHQ